MPSRAPAGSSVFHAGVGASTGGATPATGGQAQQKAELDQSYLGQVPPPRFITARALMPTKLEY